MTTRFVLSVVFSSMIACSGATGGVAPAGPEGGQAVPTVAFNHLYIVVSAAAMDQFVNSPVFRDRLAAADKGLPKFVAIDAESHSVYLRGETTYLEILGPGNHFGEPTGKLGMAFSTEVTGAMDVVEKRLVAASDRIRTDEDPRSPMLWQRELVKWDFERESPVDWYHVLHRPFAADASCVWWFSEFHPDFLPALYPDRPARETGIKRSQFLAGRHDATRWLRDIVSVVVAVRPAEFAALTADLSAVGWTLETRDDGARSLHGPAFQIVLYAAEAGQSLGLRSIGFTTYPQTLGPWREQLDGGLTVRLDGSQHGWIDFAAAAITPFHARAHRPDPGDDNPTAAAPL